VRLLVFSLLFAGAAHAAPVAQVTAHADAVRADKPELAAAIDALEPNGVTRNGRPRFVDPILTEPGAAALVLERVLRSDDDVPTRLGLLGSIPGGGDGWADDLAAAYASLDHPDLRAAAAQLARRDREGHGVRIVEAALGDTDPAVRATAVRVAASVTVSPALVRAALEDGAPEVRAAAVWTLGVVGAGGDVVVLRRLLKDADAEVRLQSLRALGRLDAPLLDWPELTTLSDDLDERVRAEALRVRNTTD
jgi:HEAT repeat protein